MVEMRLQKYLALCGVTSRRKAENMIRDGKIRVNGQVVTLLGFKVMPGDVVYAEDREVHPEKRKQYLLFYKPEMVITSVRDQFGRKTVMDYVQVNERVYPVGRLDYGTSGLLVLTNDGDFARYLSHPSCGVEKTYQASVRGDWDVTKKLKLEKGLSIDGEMTSPCRVRLITKETGEIMVEMILREGKNRQVRRMLEAVGCQVSRLERTAIGNIKAGTLQKGKWRNLSRQELISLGYDPDRKNSGF